MTENWEWRYLPASVWLAWRPNPDDETELRTGYATLQRVRENLDAAPGDVDVEYFVPAECAWVVDLDVRAASPSLEEVTHVTDPNDVFSRWFRSRYPAAPAVGTS